MYHPPRNVPTLDILEQLLQPNSILIGDVNSSSPRWGYERLSPAGRLTEQFIDDNLLVTIDTPPTFLSFAGQVSRPYLVITYPNSATKTKVNIFEDATDCGHRALLVATSTTRTHDKVCRVPRWNFKKANWGRFRRLANNNLPLTLVGDSPEVSVTLLNKEITRCALVCVSRGQMRKHISFWNSTLSYLKKNRNGARRRAERTR